MRKIAIAFIAALLSVAVASGASAQTRPSAVLAGAGWTARHQRHRPVDVLGDVQHRHVLDAVPVVDTAVVPTEEIQEELAGEQRARRRSVRRRILAWLALLVFLAAVAALVVWRLLS